MGPYHGAVSGGRRHGFILHGPASLGPHQGPTSRVRITRQHQGPASRTRATGRHGPASRADATGRRHGSASRADATGPHHGPTPRARITGRRYVAPNCFEGTVLKALVACRTSRRLSDFRYPTPGYKKSPGSRPFRARYTNVEPPDGDGLWSGQRPQPVEVIEWGGPCPATWAR